MKCQMIKCTQEKVIYDIPNFPKSLLLTVLFKKYILLTILMSKSKTDLVGLEAGVPWQGLLSKIYLLNLKFLKLIFLTATKLS